MSTHTLATLQMQLHAQDPVDWSMQLALGSIAVGIGYLPNCDTDEDISPRLRVAIDSVQVEVRVSAAVHGCMTQVGGRVASTLSKK